MLLTLVLAIACQGPADPDDTGSGTVDWSGALPPLAGEVDPIRGFTLQRAIVHLHSPYSHDACDGDGLIDGEPDPACLESLREGLCALSVDVAFASDHPSHAAEQPYLDLLLAQDGDTPISVDGTVVGNGIACGDGHTVAWLPGIEDELMPVALDRHVSEDPEENDRIYNSSDEEAVLAEIAAGAVLLMAHTEGRDLSDLERLQDLGLRGVEMFNLHAMFAPDIRQEDLGLDGFDWLTGIGDFIHEDGEAEPDLLFLAAFQEQGPSIERWDALLARGAMAGVGGTDAHQNAIPMVLRDGERGDSFRRNMRWFSNMLLAEDDSAEAAEAALSAGRLYVAFEILGIPDGFDFHLVDGTGAVWEMGSDAPPGTLHVGCPSLSATSPRGTEAPEMAVILYRDGVPWQTECGAFEVDGPATYRVRMDLTPHHLRPFLGAEPDKWVVPYPWIYGNAIRVGGG
ncbi:MAG: hypothetical protein JRJ84_10325 [Deltaproteobacteria bacterium]|nr:hypothetical protein [Deltaproteobacteria bacterium]